MSASFPPCCGFILASAGLGVSHCRIFLLPQSPLLLRFIFIRSLADIIQSMASRDGSQISIFSLDLTPELQTYTLNSFLSVFVRCSLSFSNLMCQSTTADLFSSPSLYHVRQWHFQAPPLFELQTFGIFDLSLFHTLPCRIPWK